MKPILIQDQTPTRVIYCGVQYSSMNEFAVKHKFYNADKRRLLVKFIWANFRDLRLKDRYNNNVYNIDSADDYRKEKLRLYLKGRSYSKKEKAIQVIYKNKLYVSLYNLADELGLCKVELLRAIHSNDRKNSEENKENNNNKKNKRLKLNSTLKLDKQTENIIEEKIRLKQQNKRKDSIRIIYNNKYKNYVFNSINQLANKIDINTSTIRSFMFKNNIKAIDYEIDLNNTKIEGYKLLREYIEKNDNKKHKSLIPFEDKVNDFATAKGISKFKIISFIRDMKIKDINELKKYYKYV